MSITLDVPHPSKVFPKTSHSANYFDTISIIITPDNKVRLTKVPHKPFHRQENRDPLAYNLNCNDPEKTSIYRESIVTIDSDYISGELFDEHFDGTSFAPKSLKTPIPELPRKKQFTRKAKNMILQTAHALKKEGYTPAHSWFFTGTLPGNSVEACEGISRYSRVIVNRMKQCLRRKGINFTFNVWEYQKRDKVRRRYKLTPALHLHLAITCPDCSGYEWLPEFLNKKWLEILDDISKKTPYNLFSIDEKLGGGTKHKDDADVLEYAAKTVRVEKDLAAYLSKYASKNAGDESLNIQNYSKNNNIPLFYPSSWWSVSDSLRSLAKKYTVGFSIRISPENTEKVFSDFAEFFTSIVKEARPKVSPESFPDFWCQCFYVESDMYDDIKNIVSGMIESYQEQLGVLDSDSVQLNFSDTIVRWFHLKKNKYYLDEFLYNLPAYYRIGSSSVDFSSKNIKALMREYYFKKIGNSNANKPLAIAGF